MECVKNIEHESKHKLFYLLFSIFLVMVAVRNVFHIEFPIIMFLGITLIISVFCGKDDIIAFSIACIPLSTAFQYKYALFICVVLYCIRFAEHVRLTTKVIPIVLMFFWEALHIFMENFFWFELFRGFAEFIFLAFIFSVEDETFDLKYICRIFSLTTLSIGIFILLVQLELNSYDLTELFSGGLRFGSADTEIENFGLNFNENNFGGICNLAIIGVLLNSDNEKMKLIDIIVVGFLAILGALTMSRTFLICFAILVFYYFVFQNGSYSKKITRFLLVLLMFIVSFFLLKLIFPQVIDNYISRFMEEDISNGRVELFEFYNQHIFSSPLYLLFGIGLQSIPEKMETLYSGFWENVPHNAIQEVVFIWGIFGLVLIVFLFFGICSPKKSQRNIKRKALQYGPLFVLLLTAMTGQLISNGVALIGLGFAYLCLNNKVGNQKDLYL